jgi:phage terminase large subunit-like protein
MPDCGIVVAGVEIDEGRFRVVVLAREAVGRGSDW